MGRSSGRSGWRQPAAGAQGVAAVHFRAVFGHMSLTRKRWRPATGAGLAQLGRSYRPSRPLNAVPVWSRCGLSEPPPVSARLTTPRLPRARWQCAGSIRSPTLAASTRAGDYRPRKPSDHSRAPPRTPLGSHPEYTGTRVEPVRVHETRRLKWSRSVARSRCGFRNVPLGGRGAPAPYAARLLVLLAAAGRYTRSPVVTTC